MLPRERVKLALEHKEADRVPILLGGTASKIFEGPMRQMMDFYGIPQSELEFRCAGFRYTPVCERLFEYLGSDFRIVQPFSYSKELLDAQERHGTLETRWGSKFIFNDKEGLWAECGAEPPFKEADFGKLREYQWPRPEKSLTEGLRAEAVRMSENGKYALGLYRVMEAGIFVTTFTYLCGMQNLFVLMLTEEEFVEELLRGVLETEKAFYGAVLDEIGDLLDYVEIEDDLGMQDRLMINPDLYRTMIKPLHREFVQFIKGKCAPDTKVMIHSDGAIRQIIPDFIDAGIDILNPVQVGPVGMDLKELKAEYGRDIVFDGGVDVQAPFYGTMQDVKDSVKRAVDALAPGGGYLLGPTHNFSPDIPMEKILTAFEFAKEYGKYK